MELSLPDEVVDVFTTPTILFWVWISLLFLSLRGSYTVVGVFSVVVLPVCAADHNVSKFKKEKKVSSPFGVLLCLKEILKYNSFVLQS